MHDLTLESHVVIPCMYDLALDNLSCLRCLFKLHWLVILFFCFVLFFPSQQKKKLKKDHLASEEQ